jgi:hypothetical protein
MNAPPPSVLLVLVLLVLVPPLPVVVVPSPLLDDDVLDDEALDDDALDDDALELLPLPSSFDEAGSGPQAKAKAPTRHPTTRRIL